MIDHRVSRRYAGALIDLVRAQGTLDLVDQEFAKIRKLMDQYPEITHLAMNSTISQSEKEVLIENFFASSASPILVHFLKVLISKRRFGQLDGIQEEFHRLYENIKGIQRVQVLSAFPLSASTQNQLAQVLKRKLKSEVRLEVKESPALLGGLIIRFNGNEIDASFKNRLSQIRQLLMN